MKLRWFRTCDKDGFKTSWVLQCWNETEGVWEELPCVECKIWEEEKYMHDEFAV